MALGSRGPVLSRGVARSDILQNLALVATWRMDHSTVREASGIVPRVVQARDGGDWDHRDRVT